MPAPMQSVLQVVAAQVVVALAAQVDEASASASAPSRSSCSLQGSFGHYPLLDVPVSVRLRWRYSVDLPLPRVGPPTNPAALPSRRDFL